MTDPISNLINLGICGILGAQAIVLGKHLIAFRKQAKSLKKTVTQMRQESYSRDVLEKTKLRAYVSATLVDVYPDPTNPMKFDSPWYIEVQPRTGYEIVLGGVSIKPTIRNIGQSAAIMVKYVIGQSFMRKRAELPPYPDGAYEDSRFFDLMPGESKTEGSAFLRATSQDIVALKTPAEGEIFCVYGVFRYEDMFGDIWERQFAWDMDWVDPTKPPHPKPVEGYHNHERHLGNSRYPIKSP